MPNNRKLKASKIAGGERAHPYSRKADQLRRAQVRSDKMEKQKSAKTVEQRIVVDRMVWFKYALPDDRKVGDVQLAHELVQDYISRNDEDIATLEAQRRPGRPKDGKLVMLEMIRAKDQQEYNSGMMIPDITRAFNVKMLRSWEGDYNGISRIRMMEVRADRRPPPPTTAAAVNDDDDDDDDDGGGGGGDNDAEEGDDGEEKDAVKA
ncbi:hypothetical protein DFJ73DRAFT_549993 [Zopfochytrium polystomum]|nr:hypothetical protein DFJ73DRAFT_549993 [Zopfochytrium polystomum]